ncbi:hypothetical protein LRK24_02515 [Rhodanobacter denitrificans]|uniref:hypothetical protein n=1 Tax=Rhodanobacter TaxID=75309 RepID=UPI000260D0E2|nr:MULTISPECIES: hypothetical protein [Rhodanobacter]EIM00767.1 hypothetical protein UUC_12221 [Rhodanobacter denitrificans]UJM90799.1 hypothetical protein LRK24_02515 [Rhodanobacter denitrificans]
MHSLWKDLLFLHGHLLHKDDLDWHPEPEPAPDPASDATGSGHAAKTARHALACCASVWPRIMSPR